MTSPERLDALRRFVARTLSDDSARLEVASADASFRSYYRVRVDGRDDTFIAMDAPPRLGEAIGPWLDVGSRLRRAGLNAPEVFGHDADDGFVVMSDLGTTAYLDALDDSNVDALYGDAMAALLAMQARVDGSDLPAYDEPRLVTELELMPRWFLETHLGVEPGCDGWDEIERAFRHLADAALEQPRVFVHRDFHSRNLMVVPRDNPGIIDFQGAYSGPVTYDLVSLLRDCYVEWPADRVDEWSMQYRDRLVQAGLRAEGEKRWRTWFDWMGLQRHVKVLGIFCRLHYRDGKPGYLKDLPLVLRYTLDVANRYAELAPFARWLARTVGERDITQPRTQRAA